jgi:glycosyltransferase involved in cell wall biosynthesis
LKILHCIYDHTANPWVAGGGAFRVREIYRRLSAVHEITVRCGRYPGARDYQDRNIRYEFVGTGRNNYILSTLCYAVRTEEHLRTNSSAYDVVVEDFAPYNPVFSFLWQKDAVIQLHQREGLRHLKKYVFLGMPVYLIEKFYHRFFRNAVTISEMSKEKYGLLGRVAVMPNGFDSALLGYEAEEEDYMLFLGRLHIGQKGLDTLSSALGLTKCRLVIAGGGKDEGRVRMLFSKAMGAGQAEFAGFVSGQEKVTLLGKCLFMLVPSRYEGQPLTVIEAAACGKPVIVSDIPELKYAVDAGFGISFKTGDAKDLAEKMNFLLADKRLRQEMGMRAREYARNFTWDKIAAEFEKLLLGIVREAKQEV